MTKTLHTHTLVSVCLLAHVTAKVCVCESIQFDVIGFASEMKRNWTRESFCGHSTCKPLQLTLTLLIGTRSIHTHACTHKKGGRREAILKYRMPPCQMSHRQQEEEVPKGFGTVWWWLDHTHTPNKKKSSIKPRLLALLFLQG